MGGSFDFLSIDIDPLSSLGSAFVSFPCASLVVDLHPHVPIPVLYFYSHKVHECFIESSSRRRRRLMIHI